jgi:hypothetical protein
MTQSLNTLYAEAQLALAAYADLSEQMPPEDYLTALGPAGMGDAQARAFVSEYRVVDQYGGKMSQPYVDEFGIERQVTVETGLSVTLFERIADGQRVVAVRGTEISDLRDLKNDLLLLLGGAKVLPQQAALNAKVQAWLEGGQLAPGFTVTGHSLGGFLATGLTAAFGSQIANVYAYNAAVAAAASREHVRGRCVEGDQRASAPRHLADHRARGIGGQSDRRARGRAGFQFGHAEGACPQS